MSRRGFGKFLLGAGIGAGLGMLFAPKKGAELRKELSKKMDDLINKAKELKLNYVVDIFPYYGSDVGAAWSAGHDFKGALIGPGVHASHGMERTNISGI